jgi:hypothetical protein
MLCTQHTYGLDKINVSSCADIDRLTAKPQTEIERDSSGEERALREVSNVYTCLFRYIKHRSCNYDDQATAEFHIYTEFNKFTHAFI